MRNKKWVFVTADIDEEGNKRPRVIKFGDDVYTIDSVMDIKKCASFKAGGIGERYTIRIGASITYLFCENGRWFVEEKERPRI